MQSLRAGQASLQDFGYAPPVIVAEGRCTAILLAYEAIGEWPAALAPLLPLADVCFKCYLMEG